MVPGALLFGALASPALVHEVAEGGVACPFLAVTGVPCPFCGMTHATLALGQGDLAAALAHHPLAPLVLLVTFAAAVFLARGKSPSLWGRPIGPAAVLGVVAVIWAVKLAV